MDIAAYEKILPPIKTSNAEYWDGLSKHELRLQCCDDCGTFRFPDAGICPSCLSDRAKWKAVSGRGVLWSWIIMHQQYYPAFADELPYLVAFIQLEEGPFMMSTLAGDKTELRCDMPVRVVFDTLANGRTIHKFERV